MPRSPSPTTGRKTPRAAISRSTRFPPIPATGELFDYFGGLDDLEHHLSGSSAIRCSALPRIICASCAFSGFTPVLAIGEPDKSALDACTLRANDLMALSRERIADELLKLLGMSDPSRTVAIMLDRRILRPVLPEIEAQTLAALKAVIAAEREAGVEPNALRRLAALLPRDETIAEDVGVRLRLSNKSKKRLVCTAKDDGRLPPRALAYRVGAECAVDRLLLAGRVPEAGEIASWHAPRLPISGGALIKRGLPEGPIVAQTLRRIEDRWVDEGFPTGAQFDRIVEEELKSAV